MLRRIPDVAPFDIAFFNACHGVPRFGVFAPFPCPPAEVPGWTRLVPWAVRALGPTVGRTFVVSPPTHPGVAFLLDRLGGHVLFCQDVPLPVIATLNARVASVAAARLPPGSVEGVLALSAGPRSAELDMAIETSRRVLVPGGTMVLGWRDGDAWMMES